MIKIQVNKNKMEEIEDKHWRWFSETGKKKLESYLEKGVYKVVIEKKEEIKDIPKNVYELLEFLNKEKILKSILIGNLIIQTEKYNSIDNIIEQIKCKFSSLFNSLIENSISEFLKKIRLELEAIRNKNTIEHKKNVEAIKITMKNFFQCEKEKVNEDYNKIFNIIDNIKISGRGIEQLSKLEKIFEEKTEIETNKVLKLILNDIFNYDNFIRVNEINSKNNLIRWNAYELLDELKITTCPYCNRQYIHTYISESGKTRADIDHFYPKSKYPFLSVSLYNFIPSCHTCNSSFKGSIDFYKNKGIYPYKEDFGQDAKFETKFYTDKDIKDKDKIYDIRYLLGNSDNFKIEIKPKKPKSHIGKKIQKSIDTFNIQELYNFHKDYIRELIKKAIIYNESRIDELYNQYPELFSNREEVLQMVVSNYICDEDLGKRPLAKLTKDICEELGLR
ncbi:HNH endonuclease domain-containing protein [Clostridium botulinum]|uniref:Uncharacterized protein n=1 Tax=Clostridium botulinum TaxID=1491 RepID=A0A6G4EBV0_CLOBO|nr:HNH endonuclease domain-containing protein [Clostridium botulinum]APH18131.1 HNH endonuclease family protein [Clostridium botulinum]AUM90520.1 hypothetical protein RSJ5_04320 [Clostridium botulinum]NFB13629.1 hypothetical protein [Clostridium botulinum]NFH56894.1 hypothetical protein [Clostridium botulinum]NFH60706.1 hypothetical protein [Clostridium botulinum]